VGLWPSRTPLVDGANGRGVRSYGGEARIGSVHQMDQSMDHSTESTL